MFAEPLQKSQSMHQLSRIDPIHAHAHHSGQDKIATLVKNS